MRILSDGLVFQGRGQRGVQRYFRELFERVGASHEIEMFFTGPPRGDYPKTVRRVDIPWMFPRERWNVAGRAWRQVRKRWWPARFTGHDVFHSTYYTRSLEKGIPEVVTVYDMIAERLGELGVGPAPSWNGGEVRRKREAILGARRILAISEATGADVARLLPEVAARIRVVHPGAEHFVAGGAGAEASGAAEPFALFVGERGTYKNFGVVVRAVGERSWPGGMKVVAVGPAMEGAEREIMKEAGGPEMGGRVEYRGRVTDEELAGLYGKATCFIFPSLAEGFGFPLLEAQGRGTPVICSDIGVFHEVAGEGAIFFDPKSPAALAGAVEGCRSREVREGLVERGRRNVGRFSWDRCAEETVGVYREAVEAAA